jgi:hypothetical protein
MLRAGVEPHEPPRRKQTAPSMPNVAVFPYRQSGVGEVIAQLSWRYARAALIKKMNR